MSKNIGRFPYNRVEFTRDGKVYAQQEVDAMRARIRDEGIDELVVISHGWNNDIADAESLYDELFTNADALLNRPSFADLAAKKIGVMGIFWPSKKFTEQELQPGGGASVASADDRALAEIDAIAAFSGRDDAAALALQAKAAWADLADSDEAQNRFVATIVKLLDDGGAAGGLGDALELPDDQSGAEILEFLADVEIDGGGGDGGGEFEGGAAGIGDYFSEIKKGGERLMNLLTYFEMKARAGVVGEGGAATVVAQLAEEFPDLGVHLAGHSFGGRLVSAIAKKHADRGLEVVDTMTLLQAAFSHHGFAENFRGSRDGYFRPVISVPSVRGLIGVTYSKHDSANGTAYPLASQLHREDAAALGDANDRWGAIGSNGAVKTAEASFSKMLNSTGEYSFAPTAIINFDGQDHIASHGDVTNPAVANLLLQIIGSAI